MMDIDAFFKSLNEEEAKTLKGRDGIPAFKVLSPLFSDELLAINFLIECGVFEDVRVCPNCSQESLRSESCKTIGGRKRLRCCNRLCQKYFSLARHLFCQFKATISAYVAICVFVVGGFGLEKCVSFYWSRKKNCYKLHGKSEAIGRVGPRRYSVRPRRNSSDWWTGCYRRHR